MPLTKRERIEGNRLYTFLAGEGPASKPPYKGGRFALPKVFNLYDGGYNPDYIKSIIDTLPTEDINNVGAFWLLIQNNIKQGTGQEEITYWLTHPEMKKETKERAFSLMCDSFRSVGAAQKASGLYYSFMTADQGGCDNPWTTENAHKPGYAVIPYFAAIDPRHFSTVPSAQNKDHYYYQRWASELQNRLENKDKAVIYQYAFFQPIKGKEKIITKAINSFNQNEL